MTGHGALIEVVACLALLRTVLAKTEPFVAYCQIWHDRHAGRGRVSTFEPLSREGHLPPLLGGPDGARCAKSLCLWRGGLDHVVRGTVARTSVVRGSVARTRVVVSTWHLLWSPLA